MSDQSSKTHKPTPRRLADARKRGEIARSPELASTGALLGGMICLIAFSDATVEALSDLLRAASAGLDTPHRAPPIGGAGRAFAAAVAPASVGAMIGYLVTASVQLGWPPTFKKPSFDFARIFSFQALGEALSPKAAAGRVLKALLKTGAVVGVVAITLSLELDRYLAAPALEAAGLSTQMAAGSARVAMGAGAALAAIAVLDYMLSRRRYTKRMMMTPDEVRREAREQEGDPQVRGLRRRRMRELARRRLSVEVARADVVLVNPTEYAVALRYSASKDRAPRVVAKGRLAIAAHIRELARKAGIPILERPPLTRLIYKLVPEGREIPAQVYQAVAEVLAYVYRLKERRR
ncbi:MAG TPA: EscU/YscU/HrcU family type III secretion system export apparatus switch protein [Kofleriaceae bacterium]|nr:EscU/YscU/HrcU family type III secretion system export apparatus switch protein [Kofleriaceae bacterium]